jgi:hypothetical protein
MPYRALTDSERRELTLAALSGDSPKDLSERYGVQPAYVHKLRRKALTDWEDEWVFWTNVKHIAEEEA